MTSAQPMGKAGKGFVAQASKSSGAAMLAMLSGLLLDVALATRLGAGRSSDAFFAASRVPVGLAALLMTVAVQAWVPLLTRDRRANGTKSLTEFASRMMTVVLGAGLMVWGLASIFALPLIRATAPGLGDSQTHLAASIVPQLFLIVPLVAAAELLRGALNSTYSFVLPAAMNVFMNAPAALIVFLGHGHEVHRIAWAYVAGAAIQLLSVTGFAWSRGLHVRPSWPVRDPRVKAALTLTGRPTLSSMLNLANRTVEQVIASFLPSGSITVLSYGQRLISALGGGAFFRPITVALIPRLANAELAEDRDAATRLVNRALRLILAISLPLTAFTIALANPMIRLVFHRGNFNASSTRLLAITLAVYGTSLVGSGMQRVLLAPFYARLDTRTPLRNTAYGVLLDVALLFPCVAIFGLHERSGVLGVAVAYAIVQYFIVAHAWFRLRDSLPMQLSPLIRSSTEILLASVAGAVVMATLVHNLELGNGTERLKLFILTCVVAAVGAATIAAVYLAFLPREERHLRLRALWQRGRGRRRTG